MLLKQVLEKTTEHFKQKGLPSPRLDAELLFGHVLNFKRVELYLNYEKPLSEAELDKCRELVKRRSRGEPIAYILGSRGFYKSQFEVGPGVLIPRPETEMLVELALEYLKTFGENSAKTVDFGSGTGCIAISLGLERAQDHVTAVERSNQAMEYLRRNVLATEATNVAAVTSSVVEWAQSQKPEFDLVVANPPYISKNTTDIQESVKKFEPAEALFAEDEGMHDIRAWLSAAKQVLKPSGLVLFEIGFDQGEKAKQVAAELCLINIEIKKDYSGLDRVLVARNSP